jgi:predicted transcriptional regulator
LWNNRIVEPRKGPRPFKKITDEQLDTILKESKTDIKFYEGIKMCKILLSIKPEYVEQIFNKTKRYEYRRILAKNNVDSIIIYCTYPVKKIVGELKIKSIIMKPPTTLWKMTRHNAGVSRAKFYEYFKWQRYCLRL